jgi:hypothetical protein
LQIALNMNAFSILSSGQKWRRRAVRVAARPGDLHDIVKCATAHFRSPREHSETHSRLRLEKERRVRRPTSAPTNGSVSRQCDTMPTRARRRRQNFEARLLGMNDRN